MSRISLFATILAVLAALAAIWIFVFATEPTPEPVMDLEPDRVPKSVTTTGPYEKPRSGGVYGGVVVDQDDKPIHGARVLLVAYGTGGPNMLTAGAGMDRDPDDPTDVPEVGNFTIGGEGISDAQGRFRIAADSQSTITRVLAHHIGHFLDATSVDKPRDDIRLVLRHGGKVIGTVVDDETGRPVVGALVDIYLQQKVSRVPDVAPGSGPGPRITRKQHDMAWVVTLGHFIGEVLGPEIWDLGSTPSEALRLRTDANGRFEIGQLGNTVQLEFVISHPKYKWHDFDSDEGKRAPARMVLQPGQIVEREFRLRKGLHIAGQVLDEEGNGVPDVFVKVQSISAYYRHWWYRDKWRRTRTDRKGRFRVDGLAIGDQQVMLLHPSFKQKTVSCAAGTEDLLVLAERFGALLGTLEGLPQGREGRRVLVMFESTDEQPAGPRQVRQTVPLRPNNQFIVQRVHPGKYRVWAKTGKDSSQPIEVEIVSLQTANASFEIGAGGTIIARAVDDRGGIIDPASARLIAVRDGKERPMGTFVFRAGDLEIEGVAEGTYRLRVQAPGRISATSRVFEVSAARTANLGALTLNEWGFLRFGQPLDEDGRPAKLTTDLVLEYRVGEGPWQRILAASLGLQVKPGPVEVRASSGDLAFRDTIQVEGGKTTQVSIVLR